MVIWWYIVYWIASRRVASRRVALRCVALRVDLYVALESLDETSGIFLQNGVLVYASACAHFVAALCTNGLFLTLASMCLPAFRFVAYCQIPAPGKTWEVALPRRI